MVADVARGLCYFYQVDKNERGGLMRDAIMQLCPSESDWNVWQVENIILRNNQNPPVQMVERLGKWVQKQQIQVNADYRDFLPFYSRQRLEHQQLLFE